MEGLGRRVVAQPESERDRRGDQRRILLGDPALDGAHGQMGGRGLPRSGPALRRAAARGGPGGAANLPRETLFDPRGLSLRADDRVSFRDGNWAAVLDLAPRGDTTQAETTAPAATPIIDERIQFGALGAREVPEGGMELGFWLPGTTNEFAGGFGRSRGARRPLRGAAPLSSGEGGVLAELPGRVSLRKERVLPRHGTRRVALGVAEPQAQGDARGRGGRPPRR